MTKRPSASTLVLIAVATLGAVNCGSDAETPKYDGGTADRPHDVVAGDSALAEVAVGSDGVFDGVADGGVPRGEVAEAAEVGVDGAGGSGEVGTIRVDAGPRPDVFVDIGEGLIYDTINDVTWIADGLAFSKNIKATTSNPASTPYTGSLIGAVVGTHTLAASDESRR